MLKSGLIVTLLLALTPTLALAQSGRGGTPDEQRACSKDVNRFCRAVMNQGDFTILACLQQNRPKISPACNKVLVSNGQ